MSGKWKGEILWHLVQRKHRFGELRKSLPGITQHMLTTQLRDLEAEGLLKRTVYPEVPPRVEYEITPAARALKPVFDELLRWSQEHGRWPDDQTKDVGGPDREPAPTPLAKTEMAARDGTASPRPSPKAAARPI